MLSCIRRLVFQTPPSLRLASEMARLFSRSTATGYHFLFPGQGSQYVGMMKKVLDVPAARTRIEKASSLLGYDLYDVCANGPETLLNQTVYCQPAVVVASLAAVDSLREREPKVVENCTSVAGFSVGEFSALIFAEAISFEEGLEIVNFRAKAMQAACNENEGTMLTVLGAEEEYLKKLCNDVGDVFVANFLYSNGHVLSGAKQAVEDVRKKLQENTKYTTKYVKVSGAFHSPLMEPAFLKLKSALSTVNLSQPKFPVYSNVTGMPYKSTKEMRTLLASQIVQPVLWRNTILTMMADFNSRFVEIGPQRQLRAILRKIDKSVFIESQGFEV